nr:MAG TPA: hypothetical protein [Caudoviricetes sp.]
MFVLITLIPFQIYSFATLLKPLLLHFYPLVSLGLSAFLVLHLCSISLYI